MPRDDIQGMSMKVAAHLVVCNNCGAQTLAVGGQNVHDTLNCRCCGPDHQHGDETGMTVNQTCRTVTVLGNSVVVLSVGGGAE